MRNVKNNKNVGRDGENLATEFLLNKGFIIICRNYQKRVGEIDIVAYRNKILHFIEVKSVIRETLSQINLDYYLPEENVNYEKMLHMKRAIEIFISENNLFNTSIQIDLITVTFYRSGEEAGINFIGNIN